MPTLRKEFGDGQSFVSSFEKPDDLRSLLVELITKVEQLIQVFNSHTHNAGGVPAPDQQASALDIEVEQ